MAALEQHDHLFHRQILQLRQQQAAQQQLLQQQFNLQRQLLLENQEKALKSHFMEYLDHHRRLEELVGHQQQHHHHHLQQQQQQQQETKRSDVKHKLQEFVLQKKQREILNSTGVVSSLQPTTANCFVSHEDLSAWAAAAAAAAAGPESEAATDAEVSSLLASSSPFFKALPRISPVQEDESQLPFKGYQPSPRSSRSVNSPLSRGSSSSSLLEDGGRGAAYPPLPANSSAPYIPSPPRHGKLRPVGRTQSAPLPLGHPGNLQCNLMFEN
jgi:hypothetical protein